MKFGQAMNIRCKNWTREWGHRIRRGGKLPATMLVTPFAYQATLPVKVSINVEKHFFNYSEHEKVLQQTLNRIKREFSTHSYTEPRLTMKTLYPKKQLENNFLFWLENLKLIFFFHKSDENVSHRIPYHTVMFAFLCWRRNVSSPKELLNEILMVRFIRAVMCTVSRRSKQIECDVAAR